MTQINYPTICSIQSVTRIENKRLSSRLSVPAYFDFVLSGDNRYKVFCTPLHFPYTHEFYNKLAEIQALRGVINIGTNVIGLHYINYIDPNNMFSYTENISQTVQGTLVRWHMNPGAGNHTMQVYWDNWNPLGIICVGVHAWRHLGNAHNFDSWAGLVTNTGNMVYTGNTNFIQNSNWNAINITQYRYASGQYRYYDSNSTNPGYVAFYLRQLQIVKLNGEVQKYYSFT